MEKNKSSVTFVIECLQGKESSTDFISYLWSLRNLHELCVAEQLGDYEAVLYDFRTNFDYLYGEFNIPMTLKIHVIVHHYKEYFEWNNKTMRFTDAKFTETAHSTFKMSERIRKLKITRKIGTPIHKEMALKSLVWHNSKRAGYVSPNDFRLRTSTKFVHSCVIQTKSIKFKQSQFLKIS